MSTAGPVGIREISGEAPTFVAFHVFGGGFSLGLQQEGAYNLGHFEYDPSPYAVDAEHNLECLVRYGADEWNMANHELSPDDVDIVIANPPCAPWSSMNSSTASWKEDPRLDCVRSSIDGILRWRPVLAAVESVPGAWQRGREFWIEQAARLEAEGYEVVHWLHNCGNLGGYQDRKRYMLLATLRHIPDEILKTRINGPRKLQDVVEAFNASKKGPAYLHSRPSMAKKQLAAIAKTPQGRAVRKVWLEEFGMPGPPITARRLSWDQLSPTVVGRWLCHPDEARCLTLGELKFLLGFPETWETLPEREGKCEGPGSVEVALLRMTRGVAPQVGRHIVRIFKALNDDPQESRTVDTLKVIE